MGTNRIARPATARSAAGLRPGEQTFLPDLPMGERPPMMMETPMGTRVIARARSGLRLGLWGMFQSPDGSGCGATRSRPDVST